MQLFADLKNAPCNKSFSDATEKSSQCVAVVWQRLVLLSAIATGVVSAASHEQYADFAGHARSAGGIQFSNDHRQGAPAEGASATVTLR